MICQRCAKEKSGIHTCTPSDLVRTLEQQNAELFAKLDKMEGRATIAEVQRDELKQQNAELMAMVDKTAEMQGHQGDKVPNLQGSSTSLPHWMPKQDAATPPNDVLLVVFGRLLAQYEKLDKALTSTLEIVTTDRCDGESAFESGVNAACKRHAIGIRNIIEGVKK